MWQRWIGINLGTALAYAALGHAALLIVDETGLASPVWPSAGLAFAVVYQFGWRVLPGVAAGSMLNNTLSLIEAQERWELILFMAVVAGIGAAWQAWVGRVLVFRLVGRHTSFVSPGAIIGFLLAAGPVACLVNSGLGTAAQLSVGLVIPERGLLAWMTWWVGDSLGVILFSPLALMLFRGQREVWRRRRVFVALPAIAAVFAGVAIFLQGAALERDQRNLELSTVADSAQYQLEVEMLRVTELLKGLRGLYLASMDVSPAEFRVFTDNALLDDPALQAISWNPWLHAAEASGFVSVQRARSGLEAYSLTEKDESGRFVPVSAREHYVPVGLIEPLASNARALGYDIASDPVRRVAIQRAVQTGALSATAPIDLVQEMATQKGSLVLVPIYDSPDIPSTLTERTERISGFAVGVYRWGDLLNAAFTPGAWNGTTLTLRDVTDAVPVEMATRLSALDGTAQPTQVRILHFGGRTWELGVTRVEPLTAAPQLVNSPTVMLLGLFMALFLMAFLLLVSGMEHQARTDAEVDSLTGLLNRRALLARLEAARRRSQTAGSSHVLLFVDLDGLKRVNDTTGHEAGDVVLREVAAVLQGVVRERDTVARIGGDEFAVVLLDCGRERGVSIGQDIVDRVAATRPTIAGTEHWVGASVGLTLIEAPDPADVPTLLREADLACYAVKRRGGGAVSTFTNASTGA